MVSFAKASIFILFLLLHILSASAELDTKDLSKLDPMLKPLLLNLSAGYAPGALMDIRGMSGPRRTVNAIIKLQGDPSSLKALGVNVRSKINDIVTADIPIDALGDVIRMSNVSYVRAARKMNISRQMQPALDLSVPETKANQVWKSLPGYTGKGVIIGIIDTGIDWRNPDFMNTDGTSRILYIWDQTIDTPMRFPDGFNYGTEWKKTDIESGQCQEMDVEGHGTHVAGIAGSNGNNGPQFVGVAPEAEFIVVKSTFEDPDIIDAANYIFNKADKMRKPAVINMSFGNLWGPRDGTDLVDLAMTELLSYPGRSIVASAGNEGGKSVHLGVTLLSSSIYGPYPWAAIKPLIGASLVAIEIWSKPREALAVRFLVPSNEYGDLSDLKIGWVSKGELKVFNIVGGPLDGAEVVIDATHYASEGYSPNYDHIYIHISDNGDRTIPIDRYIYGLEFLGFGVSFDAYLPHYAVFANKVDGSIAAPPSLFLLTGDGNKTILSPSSAVGVISVASYVTKSQWIDVENRLRKESLKEGAISEFSSRGPLIDGTLKPDISAPGEYIVSSFSADGSERPYAIYQDGNHVILRGTSMSSPHVAGAIALLYQQSPNLSVWEIRNRLLSSAVDAGPAGWDRAWGYGKLNVTGLLNIPETPDGLNIKILSNNMVVNWMSNREDNIAGYKIYIRKEGEDVPKAIDVGNSTEFTLSGADGKIYISISAYNREGNESSRTKELEVDLQIGYKDAVPPAKPKGLSARPIDGGLSLSWSENIEYDLAGYKVHYGLASRQYTSTIDVGKRNSYELMGLSNGLRIYVAISAYDTSGNESELSEETYGTPNYSPFPAISYKPGYPVELKRDFYSSPQAYDVDNDGYLEVAFTTRDGLVGLLRYNGKYMPGWPVTMKGASGGSPAICDIDKDGYAEIIACSENELYVWRSTSIAMTGFPKTLQGTGICSPVIADIDGDNGTDIVVATKEGILYAFRSDGTLLLGFPININGHIYSSPAVSNINGGKGKEIIVCTREGEIYAINSDGKILWSVITNEQIYSSPSVADIDCNGAPEIVSVSIDGSLTILRSNGLEIPISPIKLHQQVVASPVIVDFDGDSSSLEIILCARDGLVYVIGSDGNIINGYPTPVMGYITSSPAIADVDSDGKMDIILTTETSLGYTGLIYILGNDGKRINNKFPIHVWGNIIGSSPVICDIDSDGFSELVACSNRYWDGSAGQVHVWNLGLPFNADKVQWNSFRHDPCNTGSVEDRTAPSLTISVLQNSALKKYIDVYVISSEPLMEVPTLSIKHNDEKTEVKLTMTDAEAFIYKGKYVVPSSGTYVFEVHASDSNGNIGFSTRTMTINIETQFAYSDLHVYNNYPNPFNAGTWIPFELSEPSEVVMEIYNSLGQLIRKIDLGFKGRGSYIDKTSSAYWDGKDEHGQDVASGTYFYVLKAGRSSFANKMLLIR